MGAYTVALVAWIVIVFGVMGPTGGNIAVFLVVSLVMTVILVAVALKKTEGAWAWQRKPPADTK